MPCLDVKRGEIYFAFYNITSEVNNGRRKEGGGEEKGGGKGGERRGGTRYLARIETGGRHYFINKIEKNFLVNNNNFKDLLNKLTENGVLKITEDGDEFLNPKVLIGGNCYTSFGKILSIVARQTNIFKLCKKTIYPQARYLNIFAYFNLVMKAETKNLIPIYVREFLPFGGGKCI